jgi:hypothetical protein
MSAQALASFAGDTSAPSVMPAPVREYLAAKRAALLVTAGPKVWAGMDAETRAILCLLTDAAKHGDPQRTAERAWGQFTREERSQISHLALRLAKNLAGAVYLA